MADITETIEDLAEAFNDLREEFFPDGSTCYLLSGDGSTEPFQVMRQLNGGWYLEYSKYRGWSELSHATTDPNFHKALSRSGYFAVNGEIYQIEDGETVPPQGAEPYWRIPGKRIGNQKFTPPA